MADLLARSSCFLIIIALGYILKRVGFFRVDDFHLISKLVMWVTLPAAIVSSFSSKTFDPTMLLLAPIGLLCGIVFICVTLLFNLRSSSERRVFEVLNCTGLNIGTFALPFVQTFIGSTAVVTTTLLDIGNAMICLGGSYGAACIFREGTGFSLRRIAHALFHSLAFDLYLLMTILSLLHISIPAPVASLAEMIAGSNVFLAMLMIGIAFSPKRDIHQLGYVVKFLVRRYAVAALLALACYYLLPFARPVRQTLVLLMFSPLTTNAPIYTAELKGDVELSSTLNSVSIFSSIFIMIVLLTVIQ